MKQPSQREANEIVKDRLGVAYSVVNINGYWLIGHDAYRTDNSFGRVSPDPLRKSLDKAITDIKVLI